MRLVLWAALILAACAVPVYRPATASLSLPLPEGSFGRALAVVADRYPVIVTKDEDGFRIQTAWVSHSHDGVPGQRRATVFIEDHGTLNVVVEVRYLEFSWLSDDARWSSIRADQELEGELLGTLVDSVQ
ncbi:MAG: hypothetical protein QF412_08485 [Planctomycetota bacterium]|nr:hypothetical protein [Planctomycetota bacterium]